ncbi:hypothetical protein DUNSADRAFT_15488 [Dunaliella salina]|uniref:Uncharacterized protein n=1 Tax=Dunaliella salina TaxID=3046 RepID=A0ABQ7H1P0_DUNSA|nr:hypothetical protein DUNSADRAFT_15488 [Dunaliella salina]|eukprot:KAF5840778.1 hypothetical protein DUNSADRAFT_15488 [Dunaliella salina]
MPSFSDDRGCSPWRYTPPNSSPESFQYAQGTKPYPSSQQALHQPMPLSPRTGGHARQPQPDQQHCSGGHARHPQPDQHPRCDGHVRQPQPDQQQHQEHGQPTSGPESPLMPDLSHGCQSSAPQAGVAASRTPPLPGKASCPVSLPDIHEHPKQGLSPPGFRAEEGPHTPLDEVPHGLGTQIPLESRGSLARFIRMEPLEPVKEDTEPELSPRRELSSAERAALAHAHGLEERRKALAMVAFVRHSTADMQAAAKLAAVHSKAAPHPHALSSSSPISLASVAGPHPDTHHPAPHQQHHPHLGRLNHKNQAHGFTDGPRAFSPPAAEAWRHSKELPGSLYGLSAEFEGAQGTNFADLQWPPQLPVAPYGG